MRLEYAVKWEDFEPLQSPFTLRAGSSAGFKAALVFCGLIALLGVYCLAQGLGLPVAIFLIGLGAVGAGLCYFSDKRSVQKKKEKYDKNLRAAYQKLHCRDRRTCEIDENGFTVSCKCGTLTQPWSNVVSFSENKTHVSIGTKGGAQILPKSAFSSEAQVTEFRAFVTGKLNQDKQITSPHFDVACKPEDFRNAYWLHVLKGGGWRVLSRVVLTYCTVTYGAFVIWRNLATQSPAILFGLIGGLVGLPLIRLARTRQQHYFGPLRVTFGEEGLHLQDPTNQSRISWTQFLGYVEDNNTLLLYRTPKIYRLIPKRALTGRGVEFLKMVEAKLPHYDYKNPEREVIGEASDTPQPASQSCASQGSANRASKAASGSN